MLEALRWIQSQLEATDLAAERTVPVYSFFFRPREIHSQGVDLWRVNTVRETQQPGSGVHVVGEEVCPPSASTRIAGSVFATTV